MSEGKKANPKPASPAKAAAKTVAAPKTAAVAKKSAPETTAAAPAVEKKAAVPKAPRAKKAAAKPTVVAPDQKRQLIQVAAYFIAERRGFEGGREVDDWFEAEAEVERMLTEGLISP